MEGTPIVPNRHVVDILPADAGLQIMIVFQQRLEPAQQQSAFFRRHPVDVVDVLSHRVQTLPARHRVGADHRVHGAEHAAYVLGGAARLVVDFDACPCSGVVEVGSREGTGQAVEHLLEGWGDAVVEFVAGGPEGVYGGNKIKLDSLFGDVVDMERPTSASFGYLCESQTRVICRDGLESDVRMPLITRLFLLTQRVV